MAASKSTVSDGDHVTLSKFLFNQDALPKRNIMRLTEILTTVQIIAKTISAMLRRICLYDKVKMQEPRSAQILAHEVFVDLLSNSHTTGVLISTITKHVIDVEKEKKGRYIVTFDPLNGLSNVPLGITTGSIFSIMAKGDESVPEVGDVLKTDNKILAAGYVLYGITTILVFTTGEGVNEFTLDPQIGEFFLTNRKITIPRKGSVYAVNEGYMGLWEEPIKDYIRERKLPTDKKKLIKGRYAGSLVADIHMILKSGGFFMYPATKEFPTGKLRVLCECKPMAFIMKDAGGMATDGSISILDFIATDIHEKCPIFLGSRHDVEGFLEFTAKTPGHKS